MKCQNEYQYDGVLSIMSLLKPRVLLRLWFLLVSIALIWLIVSFGPWCTVWSRKIEGSQLNIAQKESLLAERELELGRVAENLESMERQLQQHFPYQFSQIKSRLLSDIPLIYVVTPTHTRPQQKAELTRLSQTLLHIPRLHWIIVEDANNTTKLVQNLLLKSGLTFTHLSIKTPQSFKMNSSDPNWLKPRGVLQRNLALKWIRRQLELTVESSILYFADDDNTYDLELFKEMRTTKRVSVWPVGLVGGLRYERPIVKTGKVVAWYTFWKPKRPFAMDMAGFAINTVLLKHNKHAEFSFKVPRGYQESHLLKQLVTMDELEPKANSCTKILVWHTRTELPKLKNEIRLQKLGRPTSDVRIEV